MISAASVEKYDKVEPKDIPVVKEFLDIFLEDLPSLLLDREIKFIIDIAPSMKLISILPYRMAPIKLKESKE